MPSTTSTSSSRPSRRSSPASTTCTARRRHEMGAGVVATAGRGPGAGVLRPYVAAFAARFQLVLQYRAAAISGVATQAWFAGILIMVLAAFYAAAGGHPQPIT